MHLHERAEMETAYAFLSIAIVGDIDLGVRPLVYRRILGVDFRIAGTVS